MEQGNPSLWKDIQVHKRQNQIGGDETGRDLGKSSPNPLPWQGHPGLAAQDLAQVVLDISKDSSTSLGTPVLPSQGESVNCDLPDGQRRLWDSVCATHPWSWHWAPQS